MKFRNLLLALFCLLVFAGFGFLYVANWVVQKPFGIILFVSDSMVARDLTAARLYEGGADDRLNIETMPRIALLKNCARDFAVPDAASAATALATGEKVNHRVLSLGAGSEKFATILELAHRSHRGTGLITTGPLAAPGPAAFYAHRADSRDVLITAADFAQQSILDVALGGGAADFLPLAQGGSRGDGRDLLASFASSKRELVRTKAALEDTSSYRSSCLVGVFSMGPMAFSSQIESGSEQPSLSDMVRRAIECLQTNRKGYVLVVDAALVTGAAERNEGEHVITETLAVDRAIATARRYAGEHSLILAVGRLATGGMALNGYPQRQDHGVALLGTNASGQPAITWATGPNGPPLGAEPKPPGARNEPAAYQTPSALNTAEDVLAIGTGPGSEKLQGFLENTDIFRILKDAL